MSIPRTCPHCNTFIPIDTDFHFDEKLNLIHDECGKIVFSTESSNDIAASVTKKHYDARQYWDRIAASQNQLPQIAHQPH